MLKSVVTAALIAALLALSPLTTREVKAEVTAADQARYREPVIQFTADLFKAVKEFRKGSNRGPKEIVDDWVFNYELLFKIRTYAIPPDMRGQFNRLTSAFLEQITIMKSVPDNELEGLVYLLQTYQNGNYDFTGSKLDTDIRARCAKTQLEMQQAFAEITAIGVAYDITVDELKARGAPL